MIETLEKDVFMTEVTNILDLIDGGGKKLKALDSIRKIVDNINQINRAIVKNSKEIKDDGRMEAEWNDGNYASGTEAI